MNTEQLKAFLYNDAESLPLEMQPLDHFVDLMVELGFPKNDYEFETNGWESDFWLDFKKPNYPYKVTFSGSLFYGGFKVNKEFIT